jgi:hypothetical protein
MLILFHTLLPLADPQSSQPLPTLTPTLFQIVLLFQNSYLLVVTIAKP